MKKSTFVILMAVVAMNLAVWIGFNRKVPDQPDFIGTIQGVSFSPYQEGQDAMKKIYPRPDQIDSDLRVLKGKVNNVRTYSSMDGFENIPGMAARYGFGVTAGAWLDQNLEKNEKEIANLIRNANIYTSTVRRVIVGNEAKLRGDVTIPQLIDYIRRVRKEVSCPVSTAEPWHVWIHNPELADEVDYIAIHVLPYWERVPIERAVDWVLERYQQVRQAFPNKPVLLAEVGWPSLGERWGMAKPSRVHQAMFIRQFLNVAVDKKIEYFIMEAFDQTWKIPLEGVVGAHWGIFDINRNLKPAMEGPVAEHQAIPTEFFLSMLLGLIPLLIYLNRKIHQPDNGRLMFAVVVQGIVSALVWVLFIPLNTELLFLERLAWALLLPLQVGLMSIVLINAFEMSEMMFPKGLKRIFRPLKADFDRAWPKVSLHLAICNEPPDMVAKTLDSFAGLDYPNFEVLVLDNNTTDPAVWEPVKAYCEKLGERFRFFHLGKWPGYKAGALNFGLSVTAPDAEVVAVVDSDYIVRPDWLKSMVPYFDKPSVGFVQAPQDHREWKGNAFKEMLNWEYWGFFQIGMVHRNERDAIIQHGTMTLIRKSALEQVGRWGEWCICEDSELGLRLMNAGYESVYVPESFGRGLTPDSFAGYKRQRFRWAYGAVQIIKKHWRLFLPWNRESGLSMGQRFHFATGWMPWIGDALNVVITWLTLFWVVGMLTMPWIFGQPLYLLLFPAMGVFMFRMLHFLLLYQVRVECGFRNRIAAAVAGMALSHTIGRAMLAGFTTNNQPFLRTPKCENQKAVIQGLRMASEEVLMLIGLLLAAFGITEKFGTDNPEMMLWVAALLVQALPYAAALYVSMVNVAPVVKSEIRQSAVWEAVLRFRPGFRLGRGSAQVGSPS
jgi:exo-beta-1,3-glucanase (GH17 family)/cellulose synthase/poly-beta-1,6-N-acetylglucosamine synthase-like glycosyltransferase